MRWAFAGLIAVHGLIHFLGFARAFDLAELPELGGPISRPVGVAWLGAGLAMLDERSARGHFTVGSVTVSAVLSFDEAGELVDFVSDNRLAASADGTESTRRRWSTPIGDYRSFGPWRVSSRGEGRWHPPGGEFSYVELELTGLEVNGGS